MTWSTCWNLPHAKPYVCAVMTRTHIFMWTPELVNQHQNGQTIAHIKSMCPNSSVFNAEERKNGCTGKQSSQQAKNKGAKRSWATWHTRSSCYQACCPTIQFASMRKVLVPASPPSAMILGAPVMPELYLVAILPWLKTNVQASLLAFRSVLRLPTMYIMSFARLMATFRRGRSVRNPIGTDVRTHETITTSASRPCIESTVATYTILLRAAFAATALDMAFSWGL